MRAMPSVARPPAGLSGIAFPAIPVAGSRSPLPGIALFIPRNKLIVVSDEGGVYRGPQAWTCVFTRCAIIASYRAPGAPRSTPVGSPFCELLSEIVFECRAGSIDWVPTVCGQTSDHVCPMRL